MQNTNAVRDAFLRNPALVWGVGAVAAALMFVSTWELSLFRNNLEIRALVLGTGIALAAFVVCCFAPAGEIDHTNRRRVLFAVMGAHVLATLYFFPITEILNDRPLINLDHSFHYYQAYRVREVFWETFRIDHYDPFFMAGYPGGTIFDLDMKGAEVFCAFTPIISVARALKLFILGAYLTMIPVIYWGSRMQGFKIEESVFGLLLFLSFWHWGRPYAGDFRYAGMFSFVLATHLCFLLVGLLRRVSRGSRIKTFMGLGPIAFLIHPTAVVTLPVPFAVSIGANRRSWTGRRCLALLGWCAVVVFINILWLEPFFKYVWMKTTTELYYQIEGWRGLVRVLWKPSCFIALSMIALAAIGVVRAAIERRLSTALPAAAATVFLFFVAGAGVYLPGLNQLEPGRFLFGAFVFLTPLAGVGSRYMVERVLAIAPSEHVRRRRRTRLSVERLTRLRRRVRKAALCFLVLAVLPLSMLESKFYYRHTAKTRFRPAVASLVDEITARVKPPGRLMIEDCAAMHYGDVHLPALLPLITGVEQIGGPYPQTFLLYYFTSFRWEETFGRPMDRWDPESFLPYLELYDVRWVLTATDRSTRVMSGLLGRQADWSQPPYAMWHVDGDREAPYARAPTVRTPEAGTPGQPLPQVRSEMNRLEVSGDGRSPGYFINYHWVPGLDASGAARIRPVHRLDDPVPFIYVEPNGESNITIVY